MTSNQSGSCPLRAFVAEHVFKTAYAHDNTRWYFVQHVYRTHCSQQNLIYSLYHIVIMTVLQLSNTSKTAYSAVQMVYVGHHT